MLGQVVAITD